MASIDRYRPPREGYQPPSTAGSAAAPGRSHEQHSSSGGAAAVAGHPSPTKQSPSGRRRGGDVPPAAPTPPQHTSRTSPPPSRSKARGNGRSPGRRSRAHTPLPVTTAAAAAAVAPTSQWFFTAVEVESTPTIVDGVQPSDERMRRAKGVNFIYQTGVMLDLPQITLWVAGVFFHRFFMRFSMEQDKGGIHHYNIAATALFLANKVEENCRKTKDIIIAVAKVAQKNAKLIIDEQSKEYWRWRDSILTYEEIMLEQLTFDLMVDNPYRHLFEILGQLDIVHNKHLRQAAWAFCNDACLTALPLLIHARDVAIAAIFFATVHTNQHIDDIRGEGWWKYLKGDEERCARAIDVMRQFYNENPLRKTNPQLPSPTFHLESTRRRADSSAAATPMDIDAGPGRSTPRRTNGVDEGTRLSRSQDTAGNGVASPMKRRDVDMLESGSDHGGRAEKRARMSEDEGELVED